MNFDDFTERIEESETVPDLLTFITEIMLEEVSLTISDSDAPEKWMTSKQVQYKRTANGGGFKVGFERRPNLWSKIKVAYDRIAERIRYALF